MVQNRNHDPLHCTVPFCTVQEMGRTVRTIWARNRGAPIVQVVRCTIGRLGQREEE